MDDKGHYYSYDMGAVPPEGRLAAGTTLPDPKAWLFPTDPGPSGRLSHRPMSQADVYRMTRRRATDAGIETQIGCNCFRATGISDRGERIRI